jgi:hypothetical protein
MASPAAPGQQSPLPTLLALRHDSDTHTHTHTQRERADLGREGVDELAVGVAVEQHACVLDDVLDDVLPAVLVHQKIDHLALLLLRQEVRRHLHKVHLGVCACECVCVRALIDKPKRSDHRDRVK